MTEVNKTMVKSQRLSIDELKKINGSKIKKVDELNEKY